MCLLSVEHKQGRYASFPPREGTAPPLRLPLVHRKPDEFVAVWRIEDQEAGEDVSIFYFTAITVNVGSPVTM